MVKANPIADRGVRIADCSSTVTCNLSPVTSCRSGVTLLEVLVSMFVLAVGLLGLASLLPVAKYYSVEASKYDRASTLAQAVYHDMQIRGYLQPKTWLDTSTFAYGAGNPYGYPPGSIYGAYAVSTANYPLTNLYSTAIGRPFLPPVVIDPLAISYAVAKGQAPPAVFPAYPVTTFPLPGQPLPGAPTIFRLTSDSRRSWLNEDPTAPGGQLAMSYTQAQRLFMSNDDLIFQLPENSLLQLGASADYRPQAVPLPTPDFQGDYSWLLTVSPDVDDVFQADVANMNRFTVSVVIFYKRDLNLDQTTLTLDQKKAPPERMVFADLLDASAQAFATGFAFPFGMNFAGGAVRLRTPPPGTTVPSSTAAWLDVRPNEWLMLSGFMWSGGPMTAIIPGSGPFPIPFCQWYRIAAVGKTTPIAAGGWYCDVQLAGPDWNNTFFAPPIVPYAYVPPDQPNYAMQYQYATLATGAIAVYEYQIVLDDSLLKD